MGAPLLNPHNHICGIISASLTQYQTKLYRTTTCFFACAVARCRTSMSKAHCIIKTHPTAQCPLVIAPYFSETSGKTETVGVDAARRIVVAVGTVGRATMSTEMHPRTATQHAFYPCFRTQRINHRTCWKITKKVLTPFEHIAMHLVKPPVIAW